MSKKIYIGSTEIAGGDGRSAYQIWLDEGNVGTEEQFMASLNGVGIASVTQTTTSSVDGGTNVWTVTKTDGTSSTFQVKNGNQGNSGYSGAAGELEVVNNLTSTDATAALSANMGRVLDEEISQLGLEVNAKINGSQKNYQELKRIAQNGDVVDDASWNASDFIPYAQGNAVTWEFGLPGDAGKYLHFYNADKVSINGAYWGASGADGTRTITATEIANYAPTAAFIRVSFNTGYGKVTIGSSVWEPSSITEEGLTTQIERLKKSSFNELTCLFINKTFDEGLNGWNTNSLITISGKTITVKYNGSANPSIGQTITMSAGKDYYFRLRGNITNINALLKGEIYFRLSAGSVFRRQRTIYDNGLFDFEGILNLDSGSDVEKTLYLSVISTSPTSPTIPGMTSGDTMFQIEMEYFVITEVANQYSRIYSEQLGLLKNESPVSTYTMRRMPWKWCAIGDSITAQGVTDGNAYVYLTQRMLGTPEVVNISQGGKTLSSPGLTDNPAMCDDTLLVTIPDDAKLITVMGGANDWGKSRTIGDNSSTDTTTYSGALNHIIDYVSENRPLARLVILCPTYAEDYNFPSAWQDAVHNANGDTMWDFMEAAKNVCKIRGIPCIELGQNCGWNNVNIRKFVKDDGGLFHPNELGGKRMAAVLSNALLNLAPIFESDY